MSSNRSNSERDKAFDIDTKIEYMNKLYEVRESNSCCDCSLATICSSSDIYILVIEMMMLYLEIKELIYLVNVQVLEDLTKSL